MMYNYTDNVASYNMYHIGIYQWVVLQQID